VVAYLLYTSYNFYYWGDLNKEQGLLGQTFASLRNHKKSLKFLVDNRIYNVNHGTLIEIV
jgi:hypothetical protein